jgi:hypothetical protein
MLYYAVLYYTILSYTISYFTILYYTIWNSLHITVLAPEFGPDSYISRKFIDPCMSVYSNI